MMQNEIDINDVVSYIQFLQKEKGLLLGQVQNIDDNLQKIRKAVKVNEEIIREL